jgi:putative transposase
VTQRGNHREPVFTAPGDHETFLALLRTYAAKHALKIHAWCLMTNHTHVVTTPIHTESLRLTLGPVHSQYAQRVNRMRGTLGHLWQGPYGACALDARHFLNAVRYVELNPVTAGLCAKAEDYPWSSARAHCCGYFDPLIVPREDSPLLAEIKDWRAWLEQGVPEDCRERLKKHERQGLPCGSPEFVESLEKIAGRSLQFRPRGHPKIKGAPPL